MRKLRATLFPAQSTSLRKTPGRVGVALANGAEPLVDYCYAALELSKILVKSMLHATQLSSISDMGVVLDAVGVVLDAVGVVLNAVGVVLPASSSGEELAEHG